MKNYATDDESQMSAYELAALDKTKVKKFNPRDTSKMFGLRYKNPDTTIFFKSAELRDEKRPLIEAEHGICLNVEPKK